MPRRKERITRGRPSTSIMSVVELAPTSTMIELGFFSMTPLASRHV